MHLKHRKSFFVRWLRPPDPPHQGFTLDPRGTRQPPWPLARFEPSSTLRSGSGPGFHPRQAIRWYHRVSPRSQKGHGQVHVRSSTEGTLVIVRFCNNNILIMHVLLCCSPFSSPTFLSFHSFSFLQPRAQHELVLSVTLIYKVLCRPAWLPSSLTHDPDLQTFRH